MLLCIEKKFSEENKKNISKLSYVEISLGGDRMKEKKKDELSTKQDPPNMPGDIPPGTATVCNKCGQVHSNLGDGGGS